MGRDIEPGARIEGLVFERELGRGAFASVWLARDEVLDRPVAVKLLRPGPTGPAPSDEKRVLAEARLVGRLRSPHIVTLHRVHRLPDGDGWLIEMEYVEEGSLEDALEAHVALPTARVRDIVRGTCRALAVAHADGVVHGDVKPANVLLGRGGEVKLADFGLASFLGDTSLALSLKGRIAGTPSYMAPEVVMGERAKPASDLWSTGVMLYRMLAGRLPFEGPKIDALFFQILHAAPIDLQGAAPDPLARLAMRCLSKRPDERPRSADELLAALDEPAPVVASRVAEAPSAAPSRTSLFGRERESARLASSLDEAAAGATSVVVVAGDVGVGKTALLSDAAALARRRGFHVLDAAATPLSGLVRPLLDAARTAVEGSTRRDEGGLVLRAEDLGSGAAAIRRVLAEPDEARPVDRQSAAWAVEQIARAIARRRPVAVLVDDAQHADGKDVRLLRDLAASLSGTRVVLVIACRRHVERTGGDAETSGLHELLAFPGAVRIDLGALPPEDCYHVIAASMPGVHIATDVAERVVDVAEGNPLFALELVRHLVESGAAVVHGDVLEPGPDWRAADLPRRFHDLVALRLANLSDEDRTVLDVAAVDGLNFDGEALAAVIERPLLVLLRQLQTLHRRGGLITPRKTGYRFEHPVVQEVIYRDLAPDLRRELHRRLAQDLESRAAKSSVDPERLGQHWERAGQRERAAPYLNRAALDAARKQEYLRAIDLASRSGLLPDGIAPDTVAANADLLFALCGSYADLGRTDRAEEILARVLGAAEARGDHELTLRASVCREDVRFHAKGAEAVDVDALSRACERLPSCIELGTAHWILGSVAKRRGDLGNATKHLRRADEIFTSLDLPLFRTTTLHQLASVVMRSGRLREAEALYAEAGVAYAAAGRRMNGAVANVNRALAAFRRGSTEGLASSLQRSIHALELAGATNHAAQATVVLAQVRYAEGDTAGAERAAEDALAVFVRTGFVSGVAGARLVRAQLAAIRGDLDHALPEFAAARDAARSAGDTDALALALAAELRGAAFAADREIAIDRTRACIDAAREVTCTMPRGDVLLAIAESALHGLPSIALEQAECLLADVSPSEDPASVLAPALFAAARAFRRADGDPNLIRRAAELLRDRPCGDSQRERLIVAELLFADALRREGGRDAAIKRAQDALPLAAALGHVWLEATLLRLIVSVDRDEYHAARLSGLIGRLTKGLASEADRARVSQAWQLDKLKTLRPADEGPVNHM